MKNVTKETNDLFCLGEGVTVPAEERLSGLNRNVMVVGMTGCGKTKSYVEPLLLHTHDASIVCAISKVELLNTYGPVLKEQGYDVQVVNLFQPQKSTFGFEPMDYLRSQDDIQEFSLNVLGSVLPANEHTDGFWNSTASDMLAALINLEQIEARMSGRRPSMKNVVKDVGNVRIVPRSDYSHRRFTETTLDERFNSLASAKPENPASKGWDRVTGEPDKTLSTTISTLSTSMRQMFPHDILPLMKPGKSFDMKLLGQKKMALFIVTSPFRAATNYFVNLFYEMLFQQLFEYAQTLPDCRLEVPVHVVCDDFAVSGIINDFDNLISVMRGAGISVSLLLQSESQLSKMYGFNAAKTIINNCDTYIYMGGRDTETCQEVACKADRLFSTIMDLPREQVIVFRRGDKPVFTRRYQIFDDPLYRRLVSKEKTAEKTEEKADA